MCPSISLVIIKSFSGIVSFIVFSHILEINLKNIIVIIKITRITNIQKGIQNGANIHNQDQLIILHNFNVINIIVSNPIKDKPLKKFNLICIYLLSLLRRAVDSNHILKSTL